MLAQPTILYVATQPDVIKDYIYPFIAILATALSTAYATDKFNKKVHNNEIKVKKLDFIDKLNIEITKLHVTFEKLRSDVELLKYFSLKNIQIALPSLDKLRRLLSEITIFKEEEIRRDITDNIEQAITLIEDINNLELNPINQQRELERIRAERLNEYRSIRMQLLVMDIYMDEDFKPVYLKKVDINEEKKDEIVSTQKKDNKIAAVEKILGDLVSDITQNRTKLDNTIKDNESRRSYLTIRILDVQNKLTQLLVKLKFQKEALIK